MDDILITNTHPSGFAFALRSDTQEQIFIPPYATNGIDLQRGKTYAAMLIENPNEMQRHRTPFMCINIASDDEPVEEQEEQEQKVVPATISERDEIIYNLISESGYMTTAELADYAGVDSRTAGNSANRLFNSGRISKADVYHRVGQQRCSFTLWAKSSSTFLEG